MAFKLSALFDLALYPALFAEYMGTLVEMTSFEAYLMKSVVVFVCLTLNVSGMELA